MQKRKNNLFISFLPLLIAVSTTGCVDLSGAKYHQAPKQVRHEPNVVGKVSAKKITQIKKQPLYRGEVHTMLVGLGVFSTGMKELSSSVVEKYNIPAPSGMWYDAGHVVRKIEAYYYKHPGNRRPIILVGHSLGANEQLKVARRLNKEGIPVDLLVTVDAVSQTSVPPNVKHAMNFYKHGYVPMFSGLRLKAVDPSKTKLDNIDVTAFKGIKVNHFTIDKEPAVQAMILEEVKKVTSNANREKA